MILDAVAISIVILLGLSPLLVLIWGLHYLSRHPHLYIYRDLTPRNRVQNSDPAYLARSSFPSHSLASSRGRFGWLGPMGYLGDTSCRFNAHSPFIRCAVNPSGPCQGCAFYEASAHLTDPSVTR
ncbi:DUF6464 family protein [Altericista sp. CCNU0014]|uniref:DUF6464 family protein n=1 Tax=Altericista sp. CCNU0014 TaxID=3082949 RepID=UPI00384C42B5